MLQRVGTCSLCGGDVMGYRGAWWSVMPPPSDRCAGCGAVRADDVIEMRKPCSCAPRYVLVTQDHTNGSYIHEPGLRTTSGG